MSEESRSWPLPPWYTGSAAGQPLCLGKDCTSPLSAAGSRAQPAPGASQEDDCSTLPTCLQRCPAAPGDRDGEVTKLCVPSLSCKAALSAPACCCSFGASVFLPGPPSTQTQHLPLQLFSGLFFFPPPKL